MIHGSAPTADSSASPHDVVYFPFLSHTTLFFITSSSSHQETGTSSFCFCHFQVEVRNVGSSPVDVCALECWKKPTSLTCSFFLLSHVEQANCLYHQNKPSSVSHTAIETHLVITHPLSGRFQFSKPCFSESRCHAAQC